MYVTFLWREWALGVLLPAKVSVGISSKFGKMSEEATDTDDGISNAVATTETPTNPPVEPPYNPKDLWLKEVKYADGSQNDFEPIHITLEERHKPEISYAHQY